MEFGDAVDGMASSDGQMPHSYLAPVTGFDNRHAAHAIVVAGPHRKNVIAQTAIYLADNQKVARQHSFKQKNRPPFQRLWHQRVISKTKGILGDLPRIVPRQIAFVDQHAHKLSHGKRRVSFIQLDSDFRWEPFKARVTSFVFSNDVANGTG